MSETLIARDLFVRITSKVAKPYVESHRVWDSSLCLEALRKQHKDEGKTVTPITEAQYQEERKAQK